ncbi:uncharacterized protein LOC122383497 [Amphibalanus amphitrite]|uniref:uncharacterized protein LOC122383497 n=1 Tax=Amphibalanus amphitrite TaxID=1232801 RepID=UPI001C90F1F5|nr:uncharacterized protein LOC122383497 [Amphibalanus amphitrite]
MNSAREEINSLGEEINSLRDEMNSPREEINSLHEEMNSSREEIDSAREEIDSAREEIDSAREEMEAVRELMAELRREIDALKEEMTSAQEENVEVRCEVARLRQALVEERAARQDAVEDLRREIRLGSAPSGRSQGDGEAELAPLKDDTCDKCDAISTCDVTIPTAEEARPAAPVPREANIYHLDAELLKMVLSKMDCWEMFRARRVCHRWRSAVDDIVSDCRRELTDRQTRDGKVPAPATSLEFVLKVQDQPGMTELRAPTAETDTDLRLVAATCHALQTANLRGFKLRVSALRRLARANASSLRELTLPAGVSDWQLEALLEPLKALEQLDVSPPVNSTGKWLRLLPKSLTRLDITGSGMTRPRVNNRRLSDGLLVGVQLATDTLLYQLAVLETCTECTVTKLLIKRSPSVTPEATVRLLATLADLRFVVLDGASAISCAVLAALHCCAQLETVQLYDTRPVTDIPALTQSEVAAVSRMAVTCGLLKWLFIGFSAENCELILTALHETDLGCDDKGLSRTIDFRVPKSVYLKVTSPPSGSKITVCPY